MSKMKNVLIMMLCLLFVSCAPRMIVMLDGVPVPKYAYTSSNPETGISIQVIAIKWVHAYEGDEEILWPEYLNMDKTYYINPDITAFVEINVKIKNPNKAYYQLVGYDLSKPLIGSGDKKESVYGIYAGRLRHNSFRLKYVLENNTSNMSSIKLKTKEGFPLITIGNFSYKVICPDPESIERGDTNQG